MEICIKLWIILGNPRFWLVKENNFNEITFKEISDRQTVLKSARRSSFYVSSFSVYGSALVFGPSTGIYSIE